MEQRFIYNGKLLSADEKIVGPGSRALRYGDGLFETMKWHQGNLILGKQHFTRLWEGAEALHLQIPKHLTEAKLITDINKLVAAEKISGLARIRLMLMRQDGGLYDCASHLADYVIQAWPLQEHTMLNANGLSLGIFTDALKSADKFSSYKHNNFLPYAMAALHAQTNKNNDTIVCNTNHRVCDSTIANVFCIKNGKISTPAVEEGCVNGVMRNFIIHSLATQAIEVQEKPITPEELKDSDEVFLTNSIYNIRWVAEIEGKGFVNNYTAEIYNSLKKEFPAIFI